LKHKKKILALTIFVTLVLIWALFTTLTTTPKNIEEENIWRRDAGAPPQMIAHAGGNKEFPGNTLEAFYNAYDADPDVIMEADVNMTADGVPILTHDTTLDRQTSLTEAPVHEVDYTKLVEEEIDFGYENEIEPHPDHDGFNEDGELKRYQNYHEESVTPLDVNYPEGVEPRHEEKFLVTTVEDLVTAFPENRMILEIKQSGEIGEEALDAVIEELERLDENYDTFGRIILGTFHDDIFDAYRELRETTNPELMISPSEGGVVKYFALQFFRLDYFYRDEVHALIVPPSEYMLNLASDNFVRTAHAHNIAVFYWTINEEDKFRELVDLGADGILTDRVTHFADVLDEYKD